jgi:hypothetical protein
MAESTWCIDRRFRRVNVWVSSRHTGVDLLLSDPQNRHALSLQVKFSKDWLVTHLKAEFQRPLRACGWWSINQDKTPQVTGGLLGVCIGRVREAYNRFRDCIDKGIAATPEINSWPTEDDSELPVGDKSRPMLGDKRVKTRRPTARSLTAYIEMPLAISPNG